MNRKKCILVNFVIFCLYTLSTILSQAQVTKISIDPPAESKGDLMISNLIESIEYVPLQTKKNNIVGDIHLFDISLNYIVVHCTQSSIVYLFKRNGEFMTQVGSIGSGPGEYLKGLVTNLFIDENRNQILIQVGHPYRFIIFNLKTGKYEKSDSLDFEGVGKFQRFYNNTFLMTRNNIRGQNPFIYELRTMDLKFINEQINTVHYENTGSGNRETVIGFPIVYQYKDSLRVRERSLNDTIYTLGKDLLFKPKYILNAGKYEVTAELRGDIENFMNRIRNYTVLWSLSETQNHLLFSYVYQKKDVFDYYDKTNKKTYHFNSDYGIPNDYDGGIAFWPQRQDNNIWYAFYNAHKFEEQLESQKKLSPRGSQQAVQKFNAMYKKLDPEDNPVLVIVKLKE